MYQDVISFSLDALWCYNDRLNNTSYGVTRFKLVVACGSMVRTHFCVSFSRSASAKTKHDRKKMYRSAEGDDCIRYATA
jgi:hypothetical protein